MRSLPNWNFPRTDLCRLRAAYIYSFLQLCDYGVSLSSVCCFKIFFDFFSKTSWQGFVSMVNFLQKFIGKPGASRRRKAIGAHRVSQLPVRNCCFAIVSRFAGFQKQELTKVNTQRYSDSRAKQSRAPIMSCCFLLSVNIAL